MGKKSKKKKKSQGPPPDGSQRLGKARKRNRMIIYGVVGFVVLGWVLVMIGFLIRWLDIGGPTPAPGS